MTSLSWWVPMSSIHFPQMHSPWSCYLECDPQGNKTSEDVRCTPWEWWDLGRFNQLQEISLRNWLRIHVSYVFNWCFSMICPYEQIIHSSIKQRAHLLFLDLVVISLIAAASKTPQLPTPHNTHRRSSRRTLTTPAVEGRFRPRRWRHLPNVASRFETAMSGVAGRKYLSFSEMDTKYYANGLVKKRIGWIWNGFEWYYQGRHIRFNFKWCTNSGEWGHSLNFSTVFVAATKPVNFLKVYGPLGVVHMKWTYLGSCLNTGTVMKVHRVPFTQMNRLFTHVHRVQAGPKTYTCCPTLVSAARSHMELATAPNTARKSPKRGKTIAHAPEAKCPKKALWKIPSCKFLNKKLLQHSLKVTAKRPWK